jgi:hypothetical protein
MLGLSPTHLHLQVHLLQTLMALLIYYLLLVEAVVVLTMLVAVVQAV